MSSQTGARTDAGWSWSLTGCIPEDDKLGSQVFNDVTSWHEKAMAQEPWTVHRCSEVTFSEADSTGGGVGCTGACTFAAWADAGTVER